MTKKSDSPNLPVRALLALEVMVERDALLIGASISGGHAPPVYHFDRRPTPERFRELHLRDVVPITPQIVTLLVRSKLVEPVDKDEISRRLGLDPGKVPSAKDRDAWAKRPIFNWYEYVNQITDEGRRVYEESKPIIEKWRSEQIEAPEEFIALKRENKKGVGAFCKVTRRTEKRVYFNIIEQGVDDRYFTKSGIRPLTSDAPQEYCISETEVFPVAMDLTTWRRLSDATRDYDASSSRAQSRLSARIAEIRKEFDSEVLQIGAAFDDELQEITGNLNDGPRR